MNRRTFLAALVGAAALDPERLLWVPGRKRIFLPPPKRVRPWTLFDISDAILEESLRQMRERSFFYRLMQQQREYNAHMSTAAEVIAFRPPPRWTH